MYIVTYIKQGKIYNYECTSAINALNEKRILEQDKNVLGFVWCKTFPAGINKLKAGLKLWYLDKLDFKQVYQLTSDIIDLEGGLL